MSFESFRSGRYMLPAVQAMCRPLPSCRRTASFAPRIDPGLAGWDQSNGAEHVSTADYAQLFQKPGVRDPEGWATADIQEKLGNFCRNSGNAGWGASTNSYGQSIPRKTRPS